MKRETKIISILASAIFALSLIVMAIPSALNSSISYEDRDSEFSDYYWGNTAVMYGFGSSSTSITFEFANGEEAIDKTTFDFLKESYNKFNYLDALGSTDNSTLSVNNIYDINQETINERVEINLELYTILNNSKELFNISNGIFDITAGKMFAEISDYIGGSGSYDVDQYATGFNTSFEDRLLLEEEDSKYYATRIHKDTMIDLGGYLKGYFTEYVRGIAHKYFPSNNREIFVNSGGSSMTYIGQHPKDMFIASPRELLDGECGWLGTDGCPGKWTGQDNWHISSSGDYNQFKMDGDTRVHHLVDPRDGTFVQDRGLVSIMSEDYASFLDALSSVFFIADPSEYSDILNSLTQEIDLVYLTLNDTQDNFTVDYIASDENKFSINDRYLPREVV